MDILGLGLPITKTPYFEGGTVTPAEIAGGADIWFDATKRENVTENGGRASSVRNSGSESSQPNPGVVDWVLSYVGTEATYEQVGGQNDLPFLKFTGSESFQIEKTDNLGTPANVVYGTEYTIMIIQDVISSINTRGVTGGRNPNGFVCRFNSSNVLIQSVYNSSTIASDSISPTGGQGFGIITCNTSDTNNTNSVRFNAQSNTPAAVGGTPVSESNIFVGKGNNSTQYYEGRIYEWALFKSSLSDADLDLLDADVQNKYNFTY